MQHFSNSKILKSYLWHPTSLVWVLISRAFTSGHMITMFSWDIHLLHRRNVRRIQRNYQLYCVFSMIRRQLLYLPTLPCPATFALLIVKPLLHHIVLNCKPCYNIFWLKCFCGQASNRRQAQKAFWEPDEASASCIVRLRYNILTYSII